MSGLPYGSLVATCTGGPGPPPAKALNEAAAVHRGGARAAVFTDPACEGTPTPGPAPAPAPALASCGEAGRGPQVDCIDDPAEAASWCEVTGPPT